jgi:hypothetical protein
LRALCLDFGKQCPIKGVMFSLRTRRLMLRIPSGASPGRHTSISRYLHRLGDHLRHLHLKCESDEHIDESLAFPPVDAVRLNVLDASSEVAFSPSLECLLASVTTHCRIQTLILGVYTDSINRPLQCLVSTILCSPYRRNSRPSGRLVSLLTGPRFVSAALRATHESILNSYSLPSCPHGRTAAIYVDPDEV